jgi:hypothetical protein
MNFSSVFLNIYRNFIKVIAHNVSAVCDVLAARIRKCVAFPGPTNCAGAMAWE